MIPRDVWELDSEPIMIPRDARENHLLYSEVITNPREVRENFLRVFGRLMSSEAGR